MKSNILIQPRITEFLAVCWIPILLSSGLAITGLCSLFPTNWPWIAAYFTYVFLDKAPERGGREIGWLARSPLFQRIRSYFQMKLVREVELDPNHNYIFGYHPHGLISFGAQSFFNHHNPDIQKYFPNINIRASTLNVNFKFPIFRDILLGLGYCSVSKQSINHIIKSGKGNSILIVVGGSEEALSADENSAKLILKDRLGFIKMAIKTGAHPVPIYAFGENSIFKVDSEFDNFVSKWIQQGFKSLGLRFCSFQGRGFFPNSIGMLPKNVPITLVVGKPVIVKQNDNPTKEDILNAHRQYMDNLKAIYDRHKHKYHVGTDKPPEIEFDPQYQSGLADDFVQLSYLKIPVNFRLHTFGSYRFQPIDILRKIDI